MLLTNVACSFFTPMKATIQHAAPLPLPSASGIEIVGDVACVIGDDAPFLYIFRAADLAPIGRITLFDTADFASGRLPKALKPDLEAMTLLPDSGRLVTIGSGATPAREQAFGIELTQQGTAGLVKAHSLTAIYAAFRRHLPPGMPLNLEALASTPAGLLFFQRPAGTTAGRIGFLVPLGEQVLTGELPTAAFSTFRYTVPPIGGHPAGLSGATWFDGHLFVTASAEDTSDPVLDGEVMGSLVGVLDPRRPKDGRFVALEWPDGRPFREKVEGIAVRQKLMDGNYELVLVTDDDQGGSTAIVVHLHL